MVDVNSADYVFVPSSNKESPAAVNETRNWLDPTDSDSPTSEYHKHISSHIPGTGEWILETDQYRRWLAADDQGALWIRGIPGSGKSVVAASFIRRFKTQEDGPVLFFFFREIIRSNRTPRTLLKDFAHGLLSHSPQLQSSLKRLQEEHGTVDEVPFEDLWRCISSALAATRRAYCVVDALDEMEPGHENFIRSLIDLANQHPQSIKLVLTSRQLLYLEERFRGTAGLIDLRLDRRNVDKDIEKYIDHRVNTREPPMGPEEAACMKQSICDRGQGLFLYARLMIDELFSHPQDIVSQLAQLPHGLGDMYTNILREHAERSGTSQSFQRLILQWITHAARPLRLLELATVIDSLPDRGGLRPEQDAKAAVRTACGPLLELCEDGIVQIIHHSLTEFFRNPNIAHVQRPGQTGDDVPVLDPRKGHSRIAHACINYLLGGCLDEKIPHTRTGTPTEYSIGFKERMQRFPFLQYSARYWPVHAAEADHSDEKLLVAIDTLLRNRPVVLDAWMDLWTDYHSDIAPSASPLHVAAYYGLRRYVEYIISDMDVNITDERDKTPLAYATMTGRANVITFLLQHGAQHDRVDEAGLAPAHHAALMDKPLAMRALLEGGADPLLPKSKENVGYHLGDDSTIGDTALFYACLYGHVQVLKAIQPKLSAQHLRNGPLHWAASAGRSNILRELLRNPDVRSDINGWDANYNTPLYLAAYAREPEAVQVLLEHGADVNAISEDNRTSWKKPPPGLAIREKNVTARPFCLPIHGWAQLSITSSPPLASIYNIQRVIHLLVNAGCDINARNHEGRTALFGVYKMYQSDDYGPAMASVLLAHGADASVTDLDGNTPLHMVERLYANNGEVVRMLVNAGTDINAARKTDGKTFIMISVDSFWCTGMDLFRSLNVDFDRQDADGNTAAHLAADSLSRSHADRWLDIANPNIRNHKGQTVLHCLVARRKLEPTVIQKMLHKGFSLESRNHRGRTILLEFLANSYNQADVAAVKALLEHGADPRATDYQGKSVLHTVSRSTVSYRDGGEMDVENKFRIMKALITAGADINAIDHDGNTILHDSVAWERGWCYAQSSARAAAKLGVNADRKNHQGRTILHLAAMIDSHDIAAENEDNMGTSRMMFVLDSQIGLDVNDSDYEGITPLHLAACKSERNSCMLIQAGADVQSRTHKGETPLHFAAKAGQANIVGLLIEIYQQQSLSVDTPSVARRTALHEAAQSGRPESVRLLLDAGADPNNRDRDGRGALHAAAMFEKPSISPETVARCGCGKKATKCYYLKCRQDVFGMNMNIFHQMGLIIQNEDDTKNIREVVRLLLDAGADPAHLDNDRYTATDLAPILGSSPFVYELEETMRRAYLKDGGNLLPVDALGESMHSLSRHSIPAIVKAVQIPEVSYALIERAISTKDEDLVEELVRSQRLRLIQDGGTTPLRLAARWGLTSMMKRLIPYASKLDSCYSSLMSAAAERALPNLEMIKLLIQNRGSRENFQSGVAKAMCDLSKGKYWWHAKALALLLDAGADPNIRGPEEETPLHIALAFGKSSIMRGPWCEKTLEILLKAKADVNAVSSTTGLVPLSTAIGKNSSSAVFQMLLDHGADPSLGKEPVIFSAIANSLSATKALLQAGVDANTIIELPKEKVRTKDIRVQTVLERAACPYCYTAYDSPTVGFREKIITVLLEYGANPNLPLHNGASTPLHEICKRNGIVKPMIQAGYDLEQRDVNGETPLISACRLEDRSIRGELSAIELINGGADIHVRDNAGLTPLHHAVWHKLGPTSMLLIEKSASVTAKDNNGLTPLYYALVNNHDEENDDDCGIDVDVVNRLLDFGADPLERSLDGRTALHFIAPALMQYSYTGQRPSPKELRDDGNVRSGDIFAEFAKLYRRFVEAGCDRNARDSKGKTPLFSYVATEKLYHEDIGEACPPTQEDMLAMFRDHDIHVANNAGDTLLHIVARRNDEDSFIQDAPDIFSTLVRLGLDPWAENKAGQSALDVAHTWNQEKILDMYARDDT
ncbi:ankyrin repeat-containing domain protein [Aspergillus ambiguus]|uniref:ankyrin repeat-containing domain protein n=1 Tax=Aspergillus ambiguus TaxID=176160 RepID=UPI003CCDE7C2